MLISVEIGYIRSYRSPQRMLLSLPNGNKGSGYNVVVGKNNTGKSTIMSVVRDFFGEDPTLTVSREARYEVSTPLLKMGWLGELGPHKLHLDKSAAGGHFRKVGLPDSDEIDRFRYIPARRAFVAEFNALAMQEPRNYERNDFVNRRNNPGYYDQHHAALIATLLRDPDVGSKFKKILCDLDCDFGDLQTDNIGGRDFVVLKNPSGREHIVSHSGDGLINALRIAQTIASAKPGSCIVIDEPELSLHPQLQRALYAVLKDASSDHQLIVLTHSPHFVNWGDLCKGGTATRAYLNSEGYSALRQPKAETLREIEAASQRDVTSRKYFDSVAMELFFTNAALLVEGPEDVMYISNYLDAMQMVQLPLVGYGCGGASKMPKWMALCFELDIVAAALFDSDGSNLHNEVRDRYAPTVRSFLSPMADIRDKFTRDESGRDTDTLLKKGVFRRSGKIHDEVKSDFDAVLSEIQAHLQTRQAGRLAASPSEDTAAS